MNISATTAAGYTYTNTTGVTQKEAVSNENVCQKQTKKEYKNVVREFKQKHPDRASHVNQQMQECVANVYDTNIRTFSKSITGGKTWQ